MTLEVSDSFIKKVEENGPENLKKIKEMVNKKKVEEQNTLLLNVKNNLEKIKFKRNINDEEYNKYFDNPDFKQGRLGNCYFVAALRSLMANGNYKKLILSSVSVISSGSGRIKKFIVKMPLGEPNGENISIEADDINMRQISGKPGNIKVKSGIKAGSLGVKVIEAAYNEYVGGKDNPSLLNMEGGIGSFAILNLLGRENVSNFDYAIPKSRYKKNSKSVGAKSGFQLARQEIQRLDFRQINNFLLGFNPNKEIVTLGSLHKKGKTDSNRYLIGGKSFFYGHAYSLVGVKKNGNRINSIDIINPHDTSKIINISYDVFLRGFSRVSGARIKKTFMNNTTFHSTMTVVDVVDRRKDKNVHKKLI